MLAAKETASKKRADRASPGAAPKARVPSAAPVNPVWSRIATRVQPKLAVSEPNDPYEIEADRLADRVLRMPDPESGSRVQRTPVHVQRLCADCEAERQDDRHLERYLDESRGAGRMLPQAARSYFEPRFGQDLGHVRVHTDAAAADAAARIHAHAFTVGAGIHFGAGRFQPGTAAGDRLLAHELTHTIQQTGGAGRVARAGARIQRFPSLSDIADSIEDAASSAAGAVGSAAHKVGHLANEAAGEVKHLAGEVADEAQVVAHGAVRIAEDAVDVAGDALDWLGTEVGRKWRALADAVGGVISIGRHGLVITVPKVCPIGSLSHTFKLPGLNKEAMFPVVAMPIGTVFLSGDIGLALHLEPQLGVQLGPLCLDGVRVEINPLTGHASISGGVSANVAASLGAEARGGIRGSLRLDGVAMIGGLPVPVSTELAALEGGVAGLVRGIGTGTLVVKGGLSYSGGAVVLASHPELRLGLAADAFLGAYGQLDLIGKKVCRIYWQPVEWHGEVGTAMGFAFDVRIGLGWPSASASFAPPTLTSFPFGKFPLDLSRRGFTDDCPIKDRVCDVLRTLKVLPSQNGGSWSWSGPYGPGPRLAGPLPAYQSKPPIASGATCRGACGPDCLTCRETPIYRYLDPATGDEWEYVGFQDCDTNAGCREHDAAFDWAADVHGEKGPLAILMPWHMAANVECTCENLAGNCLAWIFGLPPYDGKLYFADSARLVSTAGARRLSGPSCRADYPLAPECQASYPDREAVLEHWGRQHGIIDFGACRVSGTSAGLTLPDCGNGPGNLWTCEAIDSVTGEPVIVAIVECICCDPDDLADSIWVSPQIAIDPSMSSELVLELCDRGLIPHIICLPYELAMIARFGNRDRDLNLDPDKDPKAHPRPDDAPILDSFRKMYNRLDSWNIYVRTNHPELYPEFATRFDLDRSRERWLDDLKKRTKEYKERFRNLRNTDPDQTSREYQDYVLGTIQHEIEQRVRDIAGWYRSKTGSTETPEELTERVHTEGTELWRAAWRRAILQVNRVLARLWPPAKGRLIVWVTDERRRHPRVDLSGMIGELDYIGSLATGYKGPPKQQIRFNPDKFDVDANLEAPPLAKYALAIDHLVPDRRRIFGRATSIAPLNAFSTDAYAELSARVQGYDAADPFDVALDAPELPVQERERNASERLYELRRRFDTPKYEAMLAELKGGGYLTADSAAVRPDLSDAEFQAVKGIMDRYERSR